LPSGLVGQTPRVHLCNAFWRPAQGAKLGKAQKQRLVAIALPRGMGKAIPGFQDKVFDPKAPRSGSGMLFSWLTANPVPLPL
jgi:hypothetical protein